MIRWDLRDEIAWESFRATFHPDEDEALVRQKREEWGDQEYEKHYRVADRVVALLERSAADEPASKIEIR